MTKRKKAGSGLVRKGVKDRLEIERREDEPVGKTTARVALSPLARHASLAGAFAYQALGDGRRSNLTQTIAALEEEVGTASGGDPGLASRILASQAVTLDTLFTEMARRSALNFGQYPEAIERYMRLALKAQANCRAKLEALARLHQPREQTVKHVHVNQGGQAVVADQFHHHTGGRENGKSNEQSDAAGPASLRPALPCPDTFRNGVPIPGSEGEAAMQDAWRDKPRRS
jgi:hypothetical protein